MSDILKINTLKNQLIYIDKIVEILDDKNDGNLWYYMTEEEQKGFDSFLDLLSDLTVKKEREMRKITEKIILKGA